MNPAACYLPPTAPICQVPASPLPSPLPLAPAVFLGVQPGFGVLPPFALYNLTADIPGHPEGSTVSSVTLLAAGFRLPAASETPARA